MQFQVIYCRPCGYAGKAEALAEELRERFGASVEVEEGKFGQFDVLLDGRVIASRGESVWRRWFTHGAPEDAEIFEAVERHAAVQDGEACEIP